MTELTGTMDQAVKAMADREGKYLTFSLAGEEYGLGILKIREIIGMMSITTVPQTPLRTSNKTPARHRSRSPLRIGPGQADEAGGCAAQKRKLLHFTDLLRDFRKRLPVITLAPRSVSVRDRQARRAGGCAALKWKLYISRRGIG